MQDHAIQHLIVHDLTTSDLFAVFGRPGGHSGREPPDPIPNSEVKRVIADGSVGFPHVKVGHRQGFIYVSSEIIPTASRLLIL